MKLKYIIYLILFTLVASGCASNSPGSESIPNPQVPPTSYPATPASTEINTPLIESPALIKLDMLDDLNGWGVTETQIARTNDGGVTWRNVTPSNIEETGSTVDMFVLDNDHAWVQKPDFDKYPNSGVLYRTTNGGIT